MLLRRISYRIALQFTAFVFVLLLLNGALFLAVDLSNARRLANLRLMNWVTGFVNQNQRVSPESLGDFLPEMLRPRTRIVDVLGNPIHEGELFDDLSFSPQPEFAQAHLHGSEYTVFTAPIFQRGHIVAYMQIADTDRTLRRDLPERVALYLFLSGLISALTFFVGLLFARSNLKPVEQTMIRLEQFTQDASHELKTPLAVLGSTLDVALKTKKYKEGIESARQDLDGITVLVERLLELARLDAFALEIGRVDLSALVSESAEKFLHLADEQSITLVTDIAPNITVQADPTLVRQVINNLIANALKFNKPGGSVTVHLTKKDLSVTDTGIGINKHDLEHVFDRFFQAESSRSNGGLGLGLALVKRIVDLHGWKMSVESTAGEGTEFTVTFS